MANQNVKTPRFFVNEALYYQAQGNYINSVLEFNPSNIKIFYNESIELTFDYYPTYIMLFGNSGMFTLTFGEGIELGSTVSVNQEIELAGFSLLDYPSTTTDAVLRISGHLGSLSMGRYFDMPHSPELSLTLSHEYDGVKKQETAGGSTLSYANYYKPPDWGDLQAWQLDGWDRKYSGRRVWDLSFNYLSDSDIEPYHYNIDSTSGHINWKENWFTNVLHYTNGGQLPFIFCPDPSISYDTSTWTVPEFAICRFDMKTFKREQVANGIYNIKVKIKESW